MTKSELISQLAAKQPQLDYRDVELAVKELLAQMSASLACGDRIEVRGRNPKTGASVVVSDKYVPHFKPGKELRERVNGSGDTG